MKTTVSLKSLRADPRGFVNLLNQGYEVAITEHRRELTRVKAPKSKVPRKGNAAEILRVIESLPPIKTPSPDENTVSLMKRTRLEYLERKFGYKK
mgnify:CR=1 FL=1